MLAIAGAVIFALLPGWQWLLIILVPIILMGLYDIIQRSHSLWRNFPIVGRIRWVMEALRPYLRSYIVEGDLEGRPFDRDSRALIYARAKGQNDSHPFGTELDVYSDEYEWMSHSIMPNKDADKAWRVRVGTAQCSKPYMAAPLNISAMSFGSLGANAIEALNRGAAQGGFYHDTGEGAVSKYHRAGGGDLVWEIGNGYFGCRRDDGGFDLDQFRDIARDDQVKMIEIKLSQGAKPGHGGVLPAAKVTPEIAEARGVDVGQACVSPPGHSTFSSPAGLLEWAAKLRSESGGKPIGIKLCVGAPHEVFAISKAMRETGILLDYIVVDGAEGGTGAAPVELSNRVGMPLREGLLLVRNALVGCDLKDKVKLAAAGKVSNGAGLAANAAFGADWSNAARAFMFSLGCVQSMRCHLGTCPTGVATMDKGRQHGLVVTDKAQRVARFQKETVESLTEIVAAMGLANPGEIEPHHFFERLNGAQTRNAPEIYPFLGTGDLIDNPEHTPYSELWKQAQASSFRAA